MPQRYELNLWDYWRVIRKRKWFILLAFITVFVPFVTYARLQVSTYSTTATVKYIQRKTALTSLTELFIYSTADPLVTQCGIIRSLAVVGRVVKRLELAELGSSEDKINRTAAALVRDNISTKIVPNTDLIEIEVEHTDPELAAKIANTTAEAYIEVDLEEKSREAQHTRKFISRRLDEISLLLRESEDKLSQFRSEFEVTGEAQPAYNLWQDLTKQRLNILAYPEKFPAQVPEVAKLTRRIDALEITYTTLLMKYTEKHPQVIARRQQIDELSVEYEKLIDKYQKEGNPHLKRLDEQIALLQEELKQYPENEIELARLSRAIKLNSEIYSTYKKEQTKAEIEAEQVPDVTLISRATVPQDPAESGRTKNYLIGGFIALMVGLAFAFIVEHLDTSIRTIEEVEEFLKLPVLGVIPHIELPREEMPLLFSYPYLITQLEPRSAPAEAYRALRTALMLSAGKEKPSLEIPMETSLRGQTWLFVSASEKEGKSVTALNTAIALAQAGHKTCLVDVDLRGPVLHRALGVTREPGLTNFLTRECEYGDMIRGLTDIFAGDLPSERLLDPPGLQHLYFISSGKRVRNPTEQLSSQQMMNLIQRLKTDFEAILFDTCPVIPVTDAVLMASVLKEVILVHQIGRIARGILTRAKSQLETSKAKILGVVLNNIKPSEMEAGLPYYYYKHKGYYHYGYGEQK